MLLQINGEERACPSPCTIAQLIESLGLGERRIAVMLNEDVVSRDDFESTQLAEGDVVELITLAGGG